MQVGASAQAATPIHYSLGTDSTDLKAETVRPLTVDIAGGTATFGEDQADKIGLGDVITYKTGNKVYIYRQLLGQSGDRSGRHLPPASVSGVR